MSFLDDLRGLFTRRGPTQFEEAPRVDAIGLPPELPTRAAVVNDYSALGTAGDYTAHTRPNTARVYLSESELHALAAEGMYWWLCHFYPMLATYRGVSLTDDTDEIAPLAQELEALDVLNTLASAAGRGQAYGDAYLWIVVEDGMKLSDPLDPKRVRRVEALTHVAARELTPVAWETDSSSKEWGRVKTWLYSPMRQGVSMAAVVIHTSRLLRFFGEDLGPEQEQTRGGQTWVGHTGVAMGQIWSDALMGMANVHRAAQHMAAEASVAVFKIADSNLKMGADTQSTFLQHMRLLSRMKSLINGVMLTPADEMQRLGSNATGFWDLYQIAVGHSSAVTRVPQSAIFGEAPGGLTTDNEAGWRMAEALAINFWNTRLRPGLAVIVACLYGARRSGARWKIAMNPIGALSPKEQAEIRKLHTEADSIAITDGVLTPEQVTRSRYGDTGWQDAIQPATPDEEEDPAAAAMAEAQREQQADADGDAWASKSFAVPTGAKANAAKVLRWRSEHGDEVRGMTGTGWRRARQLAESATITGQDLAEIAAWFARHGAQRQTREIAPGLEATPWKDAGYVAWLGWGGDTMRAYAAARVKARDDADWSGKALLSLRVPVSGVQALAELREQARAIVGGLEGYAPGDPAPTDGHVTLVYLGAIDPDALGDIEARARSVVEAMEPVELRVRRVGVLVGGPVAAGRVPVVAELEEYSVGRLAERLLRVLAHHVVAPQWPDFRAHVTLGFAPSMPTEGLSALASLVPPDAPWPSLGAAAVVYLSLSDQDVAALPLIGRRDGGT